MATKRELYELLLDLSDCIDEINELAKHKTYELEYNDEKIVFKIFKEYPNTDSTILEQEIAITDISHLEDLKPFQNTLELLKQLYKDLADIKKHMHAWVLK